MYDIGFWGPICQMIPRDTEVMAVKCSAWTDGSGGTTSRRLQQIVYQALCDLFYSCFTDNISRLDVAIPFRKNSGQNPVPRNLRDNEEHTKYKSVCLLSWNKNVTNPVGLLQELRRQNLKLYFTFDFKSCTFIIFFLRKIYNEKPHSLYSSPGIIRTMKPGRIRLARYVVCMRKMNYIAFWW
jgi:hypothetical protein